MRRHYYGNSDFSYFAMGIGIILASTLIDTWCVGWYWWWFAVGHFGLPAMSYLLTLGVMLGLRFAINGFGKGDDEWLEHSDASYFLFARIVLIPVGLWVIGFFIAASIG